MPAAVQHVHVDHRRADVAVLDLDGPDAMAFSEQVGGGSVPQRLAGGRLGLAQAPMLP